MKNNKLTRIGKRVKGILEFCLYPFFLMNGRKPHRLGYGYYKKKQILNAIDHGLFNDGDLAPGYGFRIDERIVEYPWLFSRLPKGPGKLLDAGSILNFAYILKKEMLLNKQIFISTLAPELTCYWYNNISYIFEDLRETCFRDGFFDIIVSISTIEHIGLDNTMLYSEDEHKREDDTAGYLKAIMEYHRILTSGGRLYISVPFGKHVNHGWFQVFDTSMVDRLLDKFSPQSYTAQYFKYEADGWRRTSYEELWEANFFDIHSRREYDADFAAGARGLVCLELAK